MNKQIDLSQWSGRVYIGRENGKKARAFFHLDEMEMDESSPIDVIIPDNAQSMTSSFFMGLFSDSIQKAGTRERFFKLFRIHSPSYLKDSIDSAISHVIVSSKPNAALL